MGLGSSGPYRLEMAMSQPRATGTVVLGGFTAEFPGDSGGVRRCRCCGDVGGSPGSAEELP
eukprot:15713827-Heterocapsa_arctica.AAC.1